jgi:2-polyprenyl-3-methyl-5-hydroxy-6-metoxy-1,4-benzoquinol methylase
MLLTISTTHEPATDLGYLLHKNPGRAQSVDLSFGRAHVVYPEADMHACTAALLLDVDPVGLVRGRRGPAGDGGLLAQYVNDRPYAASSFLSVAIAQAFGTAMAGRSKERPELAATAIPLTARITAVPCRGGEELLRRLFEPLGYAISLVAHALDASVPEWGESRYYTVTLTAEKRLAELLTHVYVLVPVLDGEKHYWVGDAEVEKLLRVGEGWLATHPERELIARRYLKHRHSLVRDAIARLVIEEEGADDAASAPDSASADAAEEQLESAANLTRESFESAANFTRESSESAANLTRESFESAAGLAGEPRERPVSLNEQRLATVLGALRASGAASVLDLGCGEGRLLRILLGDRSFARIVGMDVSHRALEIAADRLRLDQLPPMQRQRIELIHGSLMYRDKRLSGFDAAAMVEVIEHLDPPRLAAFERVLFEHARPGTVVLTTPNAEYNVRWPTLPAGNFRHRDHRFEWTRAEFQEWATRVAGRFGYTLRLAPVGPVDPEVGSPTQMGLFTRE